MSGRWTYRQGLVETGNGIYAWLQPDGGWGWSNAGLVVDGDQSLLVDTLFDAGRKHVRFPLLKIVETAESVEFDDEGFDEDEDFDDDEEFDDDG